MSTYAKLQKCMLFIEMLEQAAMEFHYKGRVWKRLIWLFSHRVEGEAQAVAPSLHLNSFATLHFSLILVNMHSCWLAQIPWMKCTHTHILILAQWVWHSYQYFLAVLQVVCLHEGIMLLAITAKLQRLIINSPCKAQHAEMNCNTFCYFNWKSMWLIVHTEKLQVLVQKKKKNEMLMPWLNG